MTGKSTVSGANDTPILIVFPKERLSIFGNSSHQLLIILGANVSFLMGGFENVLLLAFEDGLLGGLHHSLQLIYPLHEDSQHFGASDRKPSLRNLIQGKERHVFLKLHAYSMLDLN